MLLHPSRIDGASLLAGVAALAILVLLTRTRWALLASLVAVVWCRPCWSCWPARTAWPRSRTPATSRAGCRSRTCRTGATFLAVAADYARRLAAVGGGLYLSGVGPELAETLRRTAPADGSGSVRIFEATPQLGESTGAAYAAGTAWAVEYRSR